MEKEIKLKLKKIIYMKSFLQIMGELTPEKLEDGEQLTTIDELKEINVGIENDARPISLVPFY